MANSNKVYAPIFPILGVLGLIFITLKLCGVISWSWWWVLAPFWGPFALIIAVLLFSLIVIGLAEAFKWCGRKLAEQQQSQQQ